MSRPDTALSGNGARDVTIWRTLPFDAPRGRGIPADAGFLKVVDRDGTLVISLEVTNESADGAVVALRKQLDAWRATHRCVTEADAGLVADTGPGAQLDAGSPARADARVPEAGDARCLR